MTLYIAQGLDLLSDYDYIAIFDADFKPDSDFLVSSSCPPVHSLRHLGPTRHMMLPCATCYFLQRMSQGSRFET